MAEIREVHFTTWQDFKDRHVAQLFGDKMYYQHGKYIFRGQGDAEWPLVSSFDRKFKFIRNRRERHDFGVELLNLFIKLLGAYELDIGMPEDAAGDERVALHFAQHYGLPTRLLDWTENAYVAALFAFEGHFIEHRDVRVAIWALDRENPVWAPSLGAEIFAPRASGNTRLRNQSGVFTITHFAIDFDSLEDYIRDAPGQGTPLFKFTLPASQARRAMIDLDAMGLNHGTLISDAQGVARLAELRELVRFLNRSKTREREAADVDEGAGAENG